MQPTRPNWSLIVYAVISLIKLHKNDNLSFDIWHYATNAVGVARNRQGHRHRKWRNNFPEFIYY